MLYQLSYRRAATETAGNGFLWGLGLPRGVSPHWFRPLTPSRPSGGAQAHQKTIAMMFWSGQRELNSPHELGRLGHNHYTIPAHSERL